MLFMQGAFRAQSFSLPNYAFIMAIFGYFCVIDSGIIWSTNKDLKALAILLIVSVGLVHIFMGLLARM